MSRKKTKEYTKIWSLNEERTQDKDLPTHVYCFGHNRSIRTRIELIQAATRRELNYLQLRRMFKSCDITKEAGFTNKYNIVYGEAFNS